MEQRTGKIRRTFSRMHRGLDGWMLAIARRLHQLKASTAMDLGISTVINKYNSNQQVHTAVQQYIQYTILCSPAGRPGSSEVPRNPLTRWDVSSIPANGIFLTKKLKNKSKNAQRAEND